MMKRIIAVDFDGVLHCYDGEWRGPDVVAAGPVRGAIAWLKALLADERLDVQIFSTRNHQPGGIEAMSLWLLNHGLTSEELDLIGFPLVKLPASLIVDDRAFCFRGKFPTPEDIMSFKPWWKVANA
jgi:hypothetical protein